MAQTFKVLSALLTYPTQELQDAAPEFGACLAAEGLLPEQARHDLASLLEDLVGGDLYDLQERYVLLFDRTRSLSLHLFEHVHGESRDRGQAMIDLKSQYEARGLLISQSELPDFLPLFLEYLSTLPVPEACDLIGQPAHIFAAIAGRLEKRGSPYASAFRALTTLAKVRPSAEDVAALLQEHDPDPNDLAALDAVWEEEAITFGPGAALGCKDTIAARIRAGRRPASGADA